MCIRDSLGIAGLEDANHDIGALQHLLHNRAVFVAFAAVGVGGVHENGIGQASGRVGDDFQMGVWDLLLQRLGIGGRTHRCV